MRRLFHMFQLLVPLLIASAVQAESGYTVKYVSAENIYLNGGKADGLTVGDTLRIACGQDCVCELEVVFTADHSASCKLLTQGCTIGIGDHALLVMRADTTRTISIDTVPQVAPKAEVHSAPSEPVTSYVKPPLAQLSASFYLQYYTMNDRGPSNLDFSQVTGRFSLKARRLLNQPLTLSIRTRGRYDQRQREFTSGVPQEAWQNRIWEFSLSYDNPASRFSLQVGRMSPRRIGSAGYLDGGLLETRVSENLRVGFFGGVEPKWAYSDGAYSINKTGAYITLLRGEPGKTYTEQSIAGVGEYFAGTVSREILVSQGRVQAGNRWSFYHTAEFDVNRSWRKEKADKSISLSSLYAGTYYRFSPSVRIGVSYDNRANYWSLETRSLVDSIFDDRIRQGARAQLELKLPLRVQTSYSFGVRNREGDPDPTLTHSLFVNRPGLIRNTSTASVQWSSFNGPFEQGRNYSIRLGDYLLPQLFTSIAYGGYEYSITMEDVWRRNNWFTVTTQLDFHRSYSVSGSVEFDNGDDLKGTRILTELGYRF